MSSIVAVKKNGLAVIGADTQFNRGNTIVQSKYQKNHKKILRFKESYLGIIGSSAHHNVMQSVLGKYRNDICFNGVQDIFDTFLRLHPKLKEDYFVNTSEDKEQEYESNQLHILLVNPYGIFDIQSYLEVTEFSRFWSIGTGDEYALGAMYAVYDKLDDPRQIAKTAISAACEFDDSSGLPLICHTVKLKNTKGQE
jgi:ATP-dependent protease HslVU (ClpYQ) peptidase subunit